MEMSALTQKNKDGVYIYGTKELYHLLMQEKKFKKSEILEFVKFKSERKRDFDYLKRCNLISYHLLNGYWESVYKV
ncbi:MAG: hypothetical protein Q8873_00630 [Bacillota bacterium]|nr:hypothetical protein [Bacillota bacterium]